MPKAHMALARQKRNKHDHSESIRVDDGACRELGVKRLLKLTKPGNELGEWGPQLAFRRGHFPYSTCKQAQAGQRAVLPVTVLMVASHAYRTVVPSWAEQVQASGASCVLGSVGARDTACVLAESLGCGCLRSRDVDDIMDTRGEQESAAYANGLTQRFDGPRARSVKQRFAYALRLMENSTRSVLMHDGDVFFKKGGLSRMLTLVRNVGLQDFVVTDNLFPRREVYDDLNWGFVWISGSRLTSLTLKCLLSTWDHASLNGTGNFFRRSQPRINRLLETHWEHAAGSRLKLCTLPQTNKITKSLMIHMSKMKRARSKIVCAVALGHLPRHFPSIGIAKSNVSRTLSYDLPPTATLTLQRKALGAALAIATKSGRALHLPRTLTDDGKSAEFCRLFDVGSIPLDAALLPRDLSCRSSTAISEAPFIKDRSVSLTKLVAYQAPTLCVQFDTLLRLAKQQRKDGIPFVKVCSPPAIIECGNATATAKGSGAGPRPRHSSTSWPRWSLMKQAKSIMKKAIHHQRSGS